ncbi:MAG: hypothetical protein ACXVZM_14950 [Terriglobales bacterium]
MEVPYYLCSALVSALLIGSARSFSAIVSVEFSGFRAMVGRMLKVSERQVRVVGGPFVIASFFVFGSLVVVIGCKLMMSSGVMVLLPGLP